MKTFIKCGYIFLPFVILAGGLNAQPDKVAEPATIKRIYNYLAQLETAGFTGTVLVGLNGKAVISKGYGFRNAEKKLSNTPQTVFDTGSITKQFTAAAILKLEMQGKLSTDDKITKYFENVPPDKKEITIHDLLRHSSGLTSGVGGDYEKITTNDFLQAVISAPLKYKVGERFNYSNVGYSLLAMIVEKVSGDSYEQYLYKDLLKSAGMEMTGYSRPAFDRSFVAMGYRGGEEWGTPLDKLWDGDAPFWHLKGNGGVLSTAEDLYKWDLALLSDKILSKEAKAKYYHPKLRVGEDENPHYGYGWDIFKTKRGTYRTQHNGSNRIFYADFHRFIDEGTTIIFLTNKADQSFFDVPKNISRIIFEPAFSPTIPVRNTAENRAFTDELIATLLGKGLAPARERYGNRKANVDLIERLLNAKGYDLLEEKNYADAINIFQLNVTAFPRSSNAFDSLAEAYMEAGKKEMSITNYKKAIELDPENGNADYMLKKLLKGGAPKEN